jgi:hypothetical protein
MSCLIVMVIFIVIESLALLIKIISTHTYVSERLAREGSRVTLYMTKFSSEKADILKYQ